MLLWPSRPSFPLSLSLPVCVFEREGEAWDVPSHTRSESYWNDEQKWRCVVLWMQLGIHASKRGDKSVGNLSWRTLQWTAWHCYLHLFMVEHGVMKLTWQQRKAHTHCCHLRCERGETGSNWGLHAILRACVCVCACMPVRAWSRAALKMEVKVTIGLVTLLLEHKESESK